MDFHELEKISLISRIWIIAAAVVNEALKFEQDRRGGFLCIADLKSGSPIAVLRCASPPAAKVQKYIYYSREKAERLWTNPEHDSAWESRNPNEGKVEGAIRGEYHILAFSGLSPAMDEAVVLMVAEMTCELPVNVVAALATLSNNQHFQKLKNAARSVC